MKKQTLKKLTLHRETLQRLGKPELLQQVAGGFSTRHTCLKTCTCPGVPS